MTALSALTSASTVALADKFYGLSGANSRVYTLSQIRPDVFWGGTAGGTANAITISPTPAITAYADGQAFSFIASANNTGSTTINISGIGAKTLRLASGNLLANTIVSGRLYEVIYDGTYFVLRQKHMVSKGDVASLLDWNGADPTGSNDNSTYLAAALAQSLTVFIPEGLYACANSTPFGVRDFQMIYGLGSGNGASSSGVRIGGSKLLLTGTATSAFTNDDVSTSLLHAGVSALTIEATGSYDWVFDFLTPVGCDTFDIDMETSSLSTGLIRHRKVAITDSCWVNNTRNLRLRVPDASTARTWDSMGNDEAHVGNSYTGGLGAIDRSAGAKYIGCRFDRTTASGAGLTVSLEADSSGIGTGNGWHGQVVGCQIEVNAGYDILIDGDANDSLTNTRVCAVIMGNQFRANTGTASIYLKNATGPVLGDITITGNLWNTTGIPEISIDESRWTNVTRTGNNYRVYNKDRTSVGLEANANLTIASGAVTYLGGGRVFLGTQGGAATDDLDTINGGSDGARVTLRTIVDTTRVVTVKNGTGNLVLTADAVLTLRSDAITLEYNAADAVWWEVSRAI